MVLLRMLLISHLIWQGGSEKLRRSIYGPGFVPMTPNVLNQARFWKLQRVPLRRLPSMRERRRVFTGAPILICGDGVMGITLRIPFKGRIFASHREKEIDCIQYVTPTTLPSFLTSLHGPCGVWSKKSYQPSATDFHLRVVVSFDYEYLTEEDRIYDLTCSYSSENVSVKAYYDTVNFVAEPLLNSSALPACHYSLRLDALDGPQIQAAIIGQLVYHRWSCPSEEYTFKVYRCFIQSGRHQSYLIINDDGCSIDEAILPHPTYDVNNGIVYTAAKAFRSLKTWHYNECYIQTMTNLTRELTCTERIYQFTEFSKSRRVLFSCMLAVCHRNDDDCMRDIPPRCPQTRRKRELTDEISIEKRLQRLQALIYNRDQFNSVRSLDEKAFKSDVAEGTMYLPIIERPHVEYEPSAPTVDCRTTEVNAQWIYVLLMTNSFSVLMMAMLWCSSVIRYYHS